VLEGPNGPPGHPLTLPGAITADATGTYHLFVTWFAHQPGEQLVTVSTSPDATHWTIGTEPIYDDLGFDTRAPGAVPTAVLQDDGQWVLYGWAARPTSQRINVTWRATAPAPEGPWTPYEEPVLDLGPLGSWDDAGAAAFSVHPNADGYALWYEGFSESDDRGAIGYATSPDGITWTRHPQPVIAPGACGTTPEAGVFLPSVIQRDGSLLMIFGGLERPRSDPMLFAATSEDGIAWTCAGEGPLEGLERFEGDNRVHSFEAFSLRGQPAILLEVLQENASELWLGSIDLS
jgi:predicted GH43/DUF377 family glycosyl hydrolase